MTRHICREDAALHSTLKQLPFFCRQRPEQVKLFNHSVAFREVVIFLHCFFTVISESNTLRINMVWVIEAVVLVVVAQRPV